MGNKNHLIKKVEPGSIAEELNVEPGDELVAINDNEIEDIFDYQYACRDEYLEVLIRKKDGDEWLLEIDKDEDEELGIEFENSFLDEYHSCHNKCIFCFIDQMPKGMRETLYFKDDDMRLSFLQGNYVTLTNLSDHDIDRIIYYHLEPINVSFQTMNKELRCKMLNNRFAGEALKKFEKLVEAGITINGQIVLCKGINDGKELRYSLDELLKYIDNIDSISVVPVGLTKFRDGLYPLEPFEKKDAIEVIEMIEEYQKKALAISDKHFVHASDEWYYLAERNMPDAESYDGYLQLANGVGMVRLLINEVREELANMSFFEPDEVMHKISIATGRLPAKTIEMLSNEVCDKCGDVKVNVFPIRNDFFGERITVSGLITGQDLINQLKNKDLGEYLLIPENMLRSGEMVFLDDYTVSTVQNALQVEIRIVKSSGADFVKSILKVRNK